MTLPLSLWVVFVFLLTCHLSVIYSHECNSNPCMNGATCTEYDDAYHCACVPGYVGYTCGNDTNECVSSPCENGGTCNDNINEYVCICAAGYNGVDCSNDTDECESSPCIHGTCRDRVDEYYCDCELGYEGIHCETDIDNCVSNACENDASCTDSIDRYECVCLDGFLGDHCETNINECVSNPCQNNSTCVDGIDEFTCTCLGGYEGIECQDETSECQSNPCLNAGSCSDLVNKYECECAAGYIGSSCEISVVCNPDNTIDVCNLPEDYNYFAMQNITSGEDIKCTVSKPNSTSISITDCSKDSDILLTYGSYDGMEENRIHGGKTTVAVTIRCNEIPDSGNIHAVNNTLVASLNIDRETDVNPTYSVTSSLDPSTTTVGSPVIWTISLPSEYILEVSSCTAFRGTDDSSSTQLHLISAGGCVVREELIGNFTDNLNGTVSASIYAFRFYDESNVFLKCNVIVCPDIDANTCDTTCSKAKRSIPSRISRSSRENKVAIVHNILHVMDEYSTATMTVPGVMIAVLLIVGAILT